MRRASLLLLVFLSACDPYGSCPDLPPVTLRSGTFQSDPNGPALKVPYPGIASKTTVVDLQAGVVNVSYVLNGKAYAEQWRIKSISTKRN